MPTSAPKPKPKPDPKRPEKKERRTDASDPARLTKRSNGLVSIPVEISVNSSHALDRVNIGWSRRLRGQNVERSLAITLNLANQITASAVVRNDVFLLRWLAALLLCELMFTQRQRNQVIATLQGFLVQRVFQRPVGNWLLFSSLATELTRSGFFDSLELREEGEVSFFTTISVPMPKAVLAEAWIWKKPIDLAQLPQLEKPTPAKV